MTKAQDGGKVVSLKHQPPIGFQEVKVDFMTKAQDGGKVVSLKHQPPLPPANAPGTHFC